MKKYISALVLVLIFISGIHLRAEDLLPSESYYKENISVNEISAQSPSLRAPGDPGFPNPGGGAEGGGGYVGSPIGDALYPLLVAGLLYGSIILYRNRKVSDTKK